MLVGGPVDGREQRRGGQDLVRLGADGAGVGLEEEVVGDGRRPVLDFQVGGEGGDLVVERDLGLAAGEASQTRDGSAAAGCAAGRAAARWAAVAVGVWLTGCTVLAAAVAVCGAVAVWWWVNPNPERTAIPATAAMMLPGLFMASGSRAGVAAQIEASCGPVAAKTTALRRVAGDALGRCFAADQSTRRCAR